MNLECQQKSADCNGTVLVVQFDPENVIYLCEKHLAEYDALVEVGR